MLVLLSSLAIPKESGDEGELARRAGRRVKRRKKRGNGAIIKTDRKICKCWLGSSN